MDSQDPQSPISTHQMANNVASTDELGAFTNGMAPTRYHYRQRQIEPLCLLYELRLYALQRVVCLGLALWIVLQTGDTVKFLVILAAGFMNAQWAMKILMGFIQAVISED